MAYRYGGNRTAYLVIGIALLVVLIAVFWPHGAFPAEEVPIAAPAAVVVPEGSQIVIPWGAWLSELASLIASIAFAGIVFALRRLPGQTVAIMQTVRAEQLLQKALDYAATTTAGAVKDKTVSFMVANEMVARAIRYTIENGAPKLVAWMGGEDGIGKKLLARIKVEADAELIGKDLATGAPVLAPGLKPSASAVSTADIIPASDS